MKTVQISCLTTGFILVLISLGILFHYNPPLVWQKVVLAGTAELGFALIIAIIVALIVDLRAHEQITAQHDAYSNEIKKIEREKNSDFQERERRLSKNIFDYIYSVKVDKNVFEYIEDKIYQNPFFRREMKIEYDFGKEIDGWVLLTCTYSCKIRNISSKEHDYELVYDVEKALGDLPPKEFQSAGVFRMELGDQLKTEEIDQADAALSDTDVFRKYKLTRKLAPDEEVDLVIGACIPKRIADSELWRSALTSDGLSVTVRFDKNRFDLKMIPVHTVGADMRIREDDHRVEAIIDEPLMPKNGVYIWWAPKVAVD